MEKKANTNRADYGVKRLLYNYNAILTVTGPVEVTFDCPFIPDEIHVDCAFAGNKNGLDADDHNIDPNIRSTVNTEANAVAGAAMYLVSVESNIPEMERLAQCNLLNTYNPVRMFDNKGRHSFKSRYKLFFNVYPDATELKKGVVLLNMSFMRTETKYD